jgi:hypothetical protein
MGADFTDLHVMPHMSDIIKAACYMIIGSANSTCMPH